jgi:hypothetical protein
MDKLSGHTIVSTAKRWFIAVWWAGAELVLVFSGLGVLVGGILAGIHSQTAEWGPLVSAALIGALMAGVLALLGDLRTMVSAYRLRELESIVGHKNLAISVALMVPLATSCATNEQLSATFNPLGYWQQQLASSNECDMWQPMIASAADSYRVSQRKWELGILTVDEYKSAVETVKFFVEQRNQCLSNAAEKRRIAEQHLKRIRAL